MCLTRLFPPVRINSAMSVADTLRRAREAPVVTWSREDAARRCAKHPPWASNLIETLTHATATRAEAMSKLRASLQDLGYAFTWDHTLDLLHTFASLRLPKALPLVHRLRNCIESIVGLKFAGTVPQIYNKEASLASLRLMPHSQLLKWNRMLKHLFTWAQSTMTMIYVSHSRSNTFAHNSLTRSVFVWSQQSMMCGRFAHSGDSLVSMI